MQRRVYGLPGKTSGILSIPVGKALLQVEFTKGCTDRKNYRPATYATNDSTFQKMIEDSTLFRKGAIILWRVYDLGGDEESAAAETEAEPTTVSSGEVATYEDVTTLKDAAVILKAKGVSAAQLRTKESAKAAAAEIGISFPNLV